MLKYFTYKFKTYLTLAMQIKNDNQESSKDIVFIPIVMKHHRNDPWDV